MSFFRKLKRRNVHRMAALYLAGAWLVLQVVDVVEEQLPVPDWTGGAILAGLTIAFPIALVISWFYELTPEGISLDTDEPAAAPVAGFTGRRIDFVIISVLCAAVILFAYDKWWIGPPPENSIAVLPFDNRSNREEDAFFAAGIHDDLLSTLAKIGTLKVISRTSVMRYRDSNQSIPEIASELDVATVLEGGIQRSANQLRINVQLIDAQTDEHLWAETYDRELTAENLFAIQSEISREIVGALQIVLTDEESERFQAMPTTSLEAYAEYVLGRQELAKRTAEALYRAEAHFEKAIELDADYAFAFAGLADTLFLHVHYGNLRPEDSFAPRRAAIDKALALDPLSGEAYASLAELSLDEGKDDAEAEEYFLRAIELSPNYATAHLWYNHWLRSEGRFEEALAHIRKAVELDPMAPVLTENLGWGLWLLGRAEEAETVFLKGIEQNPDFPNFYRTMSELLLRVGRVGEAMNWMRAAIRLDPRRLWTRISECGLFVELGDYQSAERCYDSAEEDFPKQAIGTKLFFYLASQPGKVAKLLKQLEQFEPGLYDKDDLALAHFLSGDVGKARSIWQDLWPELYGDEDIIMKPSEMVRSAYDIQRIAYVAYTLYDDGQLDRANYLFDHALESMKSMHRTRGAGYAEMDVFIHATRGDKRMAISALRESIDMGWRRGWWVLRSPYYVSMWEEPEWIELVNELEADIARQRQWYEDHKDEPLF